MSGPRVTQLLDDFISRRKDGQKEYKLFLSVGAALDWEYAVSTEGEPELEMAPRFPARQADHRPYQFKIQMNRHDLIMAHTCQRPKPMPNATCTATRQSLT